MPEKERPMNADPNPSMLTPEQEALVRSCWAWLLEPAPPSPMRMIEAVVLIMPMLWGVRMLPKVSG